ncbi:MAG: hypothetical protein ACW98Y_21675, partial [Candidatus Thorarchaeota archaeon]
MNASLSREQNKLTGSFYTPPALADDIVGRSISKWLLRHTGHDIQKLGQGIIQDSKKDILLKALGEIKVLDPSVGEGVFLLAAGEWILNTRLSLGDTKDPEIIRHQIASDVLHGVDIQEGPLQHSAQSLQEWVFNELVPI